jgi:hypothetical protein
MMQLLFKRPDGTFVADLGFGPYHVIPDDAVAPAGLWDWAVGEAARLGDDLQFEPGPPPPTPEQVQAINITNAKYNGVEFDGVMCSATAADQNGLMAVFLSIQIQGASFVPTRFSFENGSELVITLSNYQAFMAVWLPFRQSFFAA